MKKLVCVILAVMVVCLALAVIDNSAVAANTYHVPDDYSTIQGAINAAIDGDTLFDRSLFGHHWFVEVGGRLFDATGGPIVKRTRIQYVSDVIDSTRRTVAQGAPNYDAAVLAEWRESVMATDENDMFDVPWLYPNTITRIE
jgi:hypothetical protein